MSRVTHFIPDQQRLKSREKIWENAGNWSRKVDIWTGKKFLAAGKACFARRTFVSSGFSTEGDLNFCIRSPPLWETVTGNVHHQRHPQTLTVCPSRMQDKTLVTTQRPHHPFKLCGMFIACRVSAVVKLQHKT